MPQLQRCFCVTDREAEQPIGLHPQSCNKTAPGLPFDGFHPRSTCNYMDYYSFTDPEGMEGWVGLVGWPIVDSFHTKWSPVNHAYVRESAPAKDRLPNHWAMWHCELWHCWRLFDWIVRLRGTSWLALVRTGDRTASKVGSTPPATSNDLRARFVCH